MRVPRCLALLTLSAILCVGCQPQVRPEPTASGNYEYTIALEPHANADGTMGTRLSVTVRPPDPTDPAQVAYAQHLQREMLRALESESAPLDRSR